MKRKDKIKNVLQKIYFSENRLQKSRFRRTVVYLLRYVFHIGREVSSDQCLLRAAALTYTTLMTLMPVAVLLFVVMSSFGVLDDASARVQTFLFQHLLPESVAAVKVHIEGMLVNFNVQAASYISIIVLVGATYSLFSSVNSSLNVIWGGQQRSKFYSKLIHIWFIVTLAPVMLGYSLYLSTQLENITTLGAGVFLAGLVTRLMPYLVTFLAVTLLYKFVPQPAVRWRSAFLGALFAALMWEFSKYGFNYYIRNFSNYQLVYGSFLILPIFLIWINITWLIILIGAEIAYTHQNLEVLHLKNKRRFQAKANVFLLSEKMGLYILFSIIERYMTGNPLKQSELAAHAPGSGWMLETYLDNFQKEGFIIIDRKGCIVPARDPSTIQVNEILDFFEPGDNDFLDDNEFESARMVKKLLQDIKELRSKYFSDKDVRAMIARVVKPVPDSGGGTV